MDYRRLIVILILVLVIAYMNRTMCEGLESSTSTPTMSSLLPQCPGGQVRIPEADNECAVPGSTAAPSAQPTCPPGSAFGTYTSSFGEPSTGTGCVDNKTRAFVPAVPECPTGYFLFGTKCWGKCPGDTGSFNIGKTCPPVTTTTPVTTTPPVAASTRSLADVTKDLDYLKSIGFTERSENDTMKKLVAERASLGGAPPISTPPYSNNPSALANVPTPSMSCAAENFSSF